MELIDTHCHLTELSKEELDAQLERARLVGVTKAICIGAGHGVEASIRAVDLASQYSNLWCSVGIHPHDATEIDNFSKIEEQASHPRVVAIGETGLDFFRDWSPFDLQEQVFIKSIKLALKVNKPLVIHCRNAGDKCLELLKLHGDSKLKGVFHCYSEDVQFAEEINKLGFIVSFPGSLTFKKADELRDRARQIPLEQIMLETDSPYMAPEPFRGKTSEPAHVRIIAECLAKVKNLTLEEIALQTTLNAVKLFGLK